MKKLLILSLLMLTLFGCTYIESAASTTPKGPTEIATRNAVMLYTAAPSITPTPSIFLYEDDFATAGGDWKIASDVSGSSKYDGGGYRITAEKSDYMNWSILADHTFSDGILSVSFQKNAGDDNLSGAAIFWRIKDGNNFYFLQITWDGFYSINKYLDNELIEISPWKQSPYLRPSPEKNAVIIRFSGDRSDIYINDKFVTSITDTSFSNGRIGLGVAPSPESSEDVTFNDLTVYRLEAGEELLSLENPEDDKTDYNRITWKELADFLVRDHTNWHTYDAENYNCMDFAIDLVNNARAENIKSWLVGVDFYNGDKGHAFVAFDTSDKGVIFVEPQADYTYSNLKVGLDLCDDWGKSACWGVVKKIEYYDMCNHEQYCTEYEP